MNKDELNDYLIVKRKVDELQGYPEVMALLVDLLNEIERQVGEFEGVMLATGIGDALYDVMEDHGWLEEGDGESKKEIQDMVNKSIK